MPKYVCPEKLRKAIVDPIEFEIGGEEFVISKMPGAAFDWMQDIGKKVKDKEVVYSYPELLKLIGIFIGEDRINAISFDAREVLSVGAFLAKLVREGLTDEEKNEGEESSTSPPPTGDSLDIPTS